LGGTGRVRQRGRKKGVLRGVLLRFCCGKRPGLHGKRYAAQRLHTATPTRWHDGGPMPEYKATIEVTFTADDDEADVHLLECANYLENASLVLSATGRTIERI
jgi:hypothetical protein